jgi:hypothetical protein
MTTGITLRKVESRRDLKTFIEFPWTVYKDDPNWIPPLVSQRRHLLEKEKNPAFEYLTAEYYLALRGETPVGTIAAFINARHNQTHNEKIGWFGFFECIEDQAAANLLLSAAEAFARQNGAVALRGPASFTLNDECGLLIENFSPPVILMPYNPPYYQRLIESYGGFAKIMDTVSYYCPPERYAPGGKMLEKLSRVVGKVKERNQITTRRANIKDLRQEVRRLAEIYTEAWKDNWGFIPITERELDDLFNTLKQFFDPRLGHFVYVRGELAGFILNLPDFNEVLKYARPHPRVPEVITLLRAFWHWKIRPKITQQRLILLGVKPQFRALGADAALFYHQIEGALSTPYPIVDAGWVLETNSAVDNVTKMFGAETYKRYRFYQKPL